MPDDTSNGPRTRARGRGRPSRSHSVRLAYQGRGGARWTYSPTLIRSQPGSIEVSMLVPLRIGLPVEIEQPARGGAWDSAPLPASSPAPASAAIRAQVTGCQCHADGLFRIHLTLQEA